MPVSAGLPIYVCLSVYFLVAVDDEGKRLNVHNYTKGREN
jgi:hypothetical protein